MEADRLFQESRESRIVVVALVRGEVHVVETMPGPELRPNAMVAQGRKSHVQLGDGTAMEVGPNDAYEIPPGHDAWVVGSQPFVTYEWTSSRVFARAPDDDDAIVVTLLFTDVVGSTATLERVGDKAWHDLLIAHNAAMREQIAHHRGREFDTSGDGFLVIFEGAARAASGHQIGETRSGPDVYRNDLTRW